MRAEWVLLLCLLAAPHARAGLLQGTGTGGLLAQLGLQLRSQPPLSGAGDSASWDLESDELEVNARANDEFVASLTVHIPCQLVLEMARLDATL